ncbi:MAG: Uma2 family endonuclease, partial [Rectinemataceae bacterium]|nr:Uma2 family endonuclease [Rectinemataceae bacterium]
VMEVLSPSTRKKDLTIKRDAYAESGIRYYMIIDTENKNILILRNTGNEFEEIYQGKGIMTEFDLGPCKIHVNLANTWLRIPKTR